jgi:hypothetical protein
MTAEEISSVKIEKALFINGKWKIAVSLNDEFYGFRIEASSDVTDSTLSDLIYRQLEITERVIQGDQVELITKETLKGTAPKIEQRK